jgi:hypothetical protein
MIKTDKLLPFFYNGLLSEKTQEKAERVILFIAIISFFIHLAIIYLLKFEIIEFAVDYDLLKNPISAIYTPFSFILISQLSESLDFKKA